MVLGRDTFQNKNQIILDWGSAYHKFREILELKGYNEAMIFAMNVKLPEIDPNTKWGFLNQKRFLETCMKAADHAKAEKERGKIEVIAVEQPFNVQLDAQEADLFIGGRFDQLVRFMGKIWDRDFKTTTKDKATFTQQRDPDDQAIRYIVGGSIMSGQALEGVMFEAVYNAKTVRPEIYTVNTSRNQYQKDQWIEHQVMNHRQLKVLRECDTWPMDMSGKCDWCPYHLVCKAGSQGSMESILRANYKLNPWDFENPNGDD